MHIKSLWPVPLVILGLAIAILFPMWSKAVEENKDARADPHHLAGNLYFVGTPDQAAFLLIGSEGHVLVGAYPDRYRKIVDNVEQLGFAMKDVRGLLTSEVAWAEAAGLSQLQGASGAEVWAGEKNAAVLASGGRNDPGLVYPAYRFMAWANVFDYPVPRVQHVVKDGEVVRIGPLALTAHVTPGHTPGCTSWTFTVRDRERDLHVIFRCDLEVPYGASLVEPEKYPGIRADFERTFTTLRALPVDIWVTGKGKEYGRYRKYQASLTAEDPAAPFIDPDGYRQSLDAAEAKFRDALAHAEKQQ